jgi:hypothetical protein
MPSKKSVEVDENKKLRISYFLGLLFFLVVVFLLIFYWFIPHEKIEFVSDYQNYNFSLSSSEEMQFYPNLRFSTPEISYNIHDCSLSRSYDAKNALDIIEEKSLLSFYPVSENEMISIHCEEVRGFSGGIYVAGEGGPTNITKAGNFNIINSGNILLLKDSRCSKPNIAIHELLHVLGFKHSNNENNIMYNFTSCDQVISSDILDLINELYSIEGLPDLFFEEVIASMSGKYLDANVTIRNYGLVDSESFRLVLFADGEIIKDLQVDPILVGYGKVLSFSNLWVPQISTTQLEFSIETDFPELDKKNNKNKLEIK